MESSQVKNIIESLLFVARKPLSLEEIGEVLAVPGELILFCLDELILENEKRGIKIVKVAGGYLMGTNPENSEYVEKILHPKVETRLSPQALETLSVIAYKQPVTRAEIEKLRGVDCGGVLDTLLSKKLVREMGRSDAVGHPYIYGTTPEFLRHFGLHDLSTLPALPTTQSGQENLIKFALHE